MKKLQPILNSVQKLISTWNLDANHQKTIEDAVKVKTYLQAEEEHHLAELSKLFQNEVADATQQTALKNIIRQSFVKAGRDIHIGDTIHQTVLIRVGAAEERVNRYLTYDSKYQLPNIRSISTFSKPMLKRVASAMSHNPLNIYPRW
ncbi:MAG: hypothetical protein RL329_2440 [Bacteroidota bacterium]